MKKQPGVTRRKDSSVLWWGIKWPKDLEHLHKSPWAARVSLGTRDPVEAKRLAAQHQAHWLNEFAIQRRQLTPLRIESLTPELLKTIKDAIRYKVLQDDRDHRFDDGKLRDLCLALEELSPTPNYLGTPGQLPNYLNPLFEPPTRSPSPYMDGPFLLSQAGYSDPHWRKRRMLDRLKELQTVVTEHCSKSLNVTGDLAFTESFAGIAIKGMGFSIDWGRPENREHLPSILEALTEAWSAALSRHAGVTVTTPEKPTAPPLESRKPPAIKRTIMDAFEAWKANEVERDPKAVKSSERAAKQFATFMPGKSLGDLTDEDGHTVVRSLKCWAHEEGKTQTTAKNRLTSIKAMLNIAHRNKWCAVNPVSGLDIEASDSQREAWEPEELPRLFDDPIFHAYAIPTTRKAGLDAAYWVTLICLYSGGRISEICQLLTTDVEEVIGGLAMRFNDDKAEGQKLKNRSSRRTIPVHPELIRLGFKDYWRAISDARPGPLFPAVVRSGENGAGGQFSQWFSAYKTGKGFPKGVKTIHSFRHTFETELGHAGVTPTQVDAMTGHAGQGIGRAVYAKGIRHNADRLRPQMELLAFPGLSLPRVFDKPVWTVDTILSAPRKPKTIKG